MPDVAGPGNSTSSARPHPPSTAGLDGVAYRTAAEAGLEPESAAAHRVGWGFVSLYGKLSDRTSSRLGIRRPWMVIGLVGGSLGILMVALAPTIPVVLVLTASIAYGLALYAVAGVWAIIGALAILPVRGVR
jgi:MFS family permease